METDDKNDTPSTGKENPAPVKRRTPLEDLARRIAKLVICQHRLDLDRGRKNDADPEAD